MEMDRHTVRVLENINRNYALDEFESTKAKLENKGLIEVMGNDGELWILTDGMLLWYWTQCERLTYKSLVIFMMNHCIFEKKIYRMEEFKIKADRVLTENKEEIIKVRKAFRKAVIER